MKIWAKVAGVPVGVLATGGGESAKAGIDGCSRSGKAGVGATLIVGFGLAANFDPAEPGAVAREVARFFPEAACWLSTGTIGSAIRSPAAPGSRGAGRGAGGRAGDLGGTGPLAFASSDIAPTARAGWTAAMVSGLHAADELVLLYFARR